MTRQENGVCGSARCDWVLILRHATACLPTPPIPTVCTRPACLENSNDRIMHLSPEHLLHGRLHEGCARAALAPPHASALRTTTSYLYSPTGPRPPAIAILPLYSLLLHPVFTLNVSQHGLVPRLLSLLRQPNRLRRLLLSRLSTSRPRKNSIPQQRRPLGLAHILIHINHK